MNTLSNIPKGAKGIEFTVDPDPAGISRVGGWDAWQKHIAHEMEEEGITITHIESTTFSGYYFPDKISPGKWLKKEDRHPQR
jgi:hypothetical protein